MQLKYLKQFGEAPPDQLTALLEAKKEGKDLPQPDSDSSDSESLATYTKSELNHHLKGFARSRSVEKDLDG